MSDLSRLTEALRLLRDAVDDPERVRTQSEQKAQRSAEGIVLDRADFFRRLFAEIDDGGPLPAADRLRNLAEKVSFSGLTWNARARRKVLRRIDAALAELVTGRRRRP